MEYFFSAWEEIKRQLFGKFIFFFLDYDGTLAPIAETPEKAAITPENKETLAALASGRRCKVAIISGRALEDLKKCVGLEGLIYMGNHGLEIEGPKLRFKSPVSLHYLKILREIKNNLETNIAPIGGAFIEDKGLGLALHYRLVDKKDIPSLKNILHKIIKTYLAKDTLRLKTGKMVFEIRPAARWDKGKAALWLLAREHFILKEKINVIPLYIGDDVTDEDAFRALKDKGITVRIGEAKDSSARYYVKNTNEVFGLLEDIKNSN